MRGGLLHLGQILFCTLDDFVGLSVHVRVFTRRYSISFVTRLFIHTTRSAFAIHIGDRCNFLILVVLSLESVIQVLVALYATITHFVFLIM